jgi:DNA-binding beta-propeller fold protein YncE
MKNQTSFLSLLSCAIFSSVIVSCSKDKISPVDELKSIASPTIMTVANTSDAPDSLTVSTFYKGFGTLPPFRIGSSTKQTLFVTTSRRNSQATIVKITPQGVGSTLASGFVFPIGIKAASDGNVYVADFWGKTENAANLIIKVSPDGTKTTMTAPDGSSLSTRVFAPQDVAIADDNTTLYVLNTGGNTVFRINTEKVFDVAGVLGITDYVDGIGYAARLNYPTAMKLSKDGNIYLVDDRLGFADTYVSVPGANGIEFQGKGGRSIRQLNLATRKLTTIYEATGNRKIMDIAVAKKDKDFKPSNSEGIFAVFSDNTISFISTSGVETPLTLGSSQGNVNGTLRNAKFGFLTGISIHENFMDVVDMSNFSVRRIIRKK